jgi:hypothetical protein
MKKTINISLDNIIPDKMAVLKSQGIPPDIELPEKINVLLEKALDIFMKTCHPAGTISDISKNQFEEIYRGEGRNEAATPVAKIFPKAKKLTLFATTVGEELSRRISELFDNNDFALGSMLDAAASEATEKTGLYIEQYYKNTLANNNEISNDNAVMRYSPGYCGWHISGQKKLFEYLHPEEIGIILNESFLMQPLKSISGVMIAGPREIHEFEITYPFCDKCKTLGCRDRIKELLSR